MAKIDLTKYAAMVANAASQVKISSTVFKNFIADVKAVVDGNYDLLDAVQNARSGLSSNALINGNFDVWQRGVSWTNPASGTFLADRWQNGNSSDAGLPTRTFSRQPLTPGAIQGAYYYFDANFSGTGTGLGAASYEQLIQRIENGTRYLCGSGKKVTVSFYAKSTIAGKRLGFNLYQNYGTGGTPTALETINGTNVTLTSTWNKYSFSFTTNTLAGKTFGTNNDDYLMLSFLYMWGANNQSVVGSSTVETYVGPGVVSIALVQVNIGDQPLPIQPRSFADELSLCQRYYEKSYDYAIAPGTGNVNGMLRFDVGAVTTGQLFTTASFKVRKRIAPTVTLYDGTGAAGKVYKGADGKTAVTEKIGEGSFVGGTADATSSSYLAFQWTSDAEI